MRYDDRAALPAFEPPPGSFLPGGVGSAMLTSATRRPVADASYATEMASPLLNTTSLENPLPAVAVTTRVAPDLLW